MSPNVPPSGAEARFRSPFHRLRALDDDLTRSVLMPSLTVITDRADDLNWATTAATAGVVTVGTLGAVAVIAQSVISGAAPMPAPLALAPASQVSVASASSNAPPAVAEVLNPGEQLVKLKPGVAAPAGSRGITGVGTVLAPDSSVDPTEAEPVKVHEYTDEDRSDRHRDHQHRARHRDQQHDRDRADEWNRDDHHRDDYRDGHADLDERWPRDDYRLWPSAPRPSRDSDTIDRSTSGDRTAERWPGPDRQRDPSTEVMAPAPAPVEPPPTVERRDHRSPPSSPWPGNGYNADSTDHSAPTDRTAQPWPGQDRRSDNPGRPATTVSEPTTSPATIPSVTIPPTHSSSEAPTSDAAATPDGTAIPTPATTIPDLPSTAAENTTRSPRRSWLPGGQSHPRPWDSGAEPTTTEQAPTVNDSGGPHSGRFGADDSTSRDPESSSSGGNDGSTQRGGRVAATGADRSSDSDGNQTGAGTDHGSSGRGREQSDPGSNDSGSYH